MTLFLDGGSDQAGFVQIIQGRVEDPSRIKAMLADTSMLHEMRPEIIGGTLAIEPDGSFTETDRVPRRGQCPYGRDRSSRPPRCGPSSSR